MQLYNENIFLFDLLNNINRTFKVRCEQLDLEWQCNLNIPVTYSVCTDKAKISQILFNLLGNSIKFTQSGYIGLTCSITDNNLDILIVDTGTGITQEQQEKLFTPFFQGHAGQQYGGTGLGLTIVQKLVSLFGGTINLTSEKNKGTRFEIRLPMPAIKPELPPAKHNDKVELQNFSEFDLTALIVDDVKVNCDILAKVLLKLGVKSLKAANGIEALDIIKSHKLNALFIDIQMPVMDGLELLQHIKRYHPELLPNTIAISANVYHLDDDYVGAGFQYYVSKPFLLSEIGATIESILDSAPKNTP
jgi:CheY-like chemotaxis protein